MLPVFAVRKRFRISAHVLLFAPVLAAIVTASLLVSYLLLHHPYTAPSRTPQPAGVARPDLAADTPSSPPLFIPRLIHQVYLAGAADLAAAVANDTASHFRRDWWRSCRVHNPGWVYHLWDRCDVEALLSHNYPWFLSLFRNLNSTVLQADAARIFILHAHGGLYLDLDTECLQPVEPALSGYSLVLQAEDQGGRLVNNAQVAAVPAHPFLQRLMHQAVISVIRKERDPLWATGPHALTRALQEFLDPAHMKHGLPGTYPDSWATKHLQRQAASSQPRQPHRSVATENMNTEDMSVTPYIRIYGLREFFTPCQWNDWDCHTTIARALPFMRRTPAPPPPSLLPSSHPQQRHPPLVGVHHFSGSWLGLDGSKAGWLRDQATQGITRFLSSREAFEEWESSSHLIHLPTDVAVVVTAATEVADGADKQGAVIQGRVGQHCRALVVGVSGGDGGDRHVLRATAFARTLAQAGPCSVTLVADGPIRKFTEDHLESSHHKQHPEYQRARARAYEALQPLQVLQYMPPAQAAVQAVVTASPHLPQSEVAATTESDDVQQGVQSRVQGHDKAGTLCEDSNTGGGTPRSTAEAYRPGVQYIRGRLALQDSADELVPAHTLATLLRSASHAGCRPLDILYVSAPGLLAWQAVAQLHASGDTALLPLHILDASSSFDKTASCSKAGDTSSSSAHSVGASSDLPAESGASATAITEPTSRGSNNNSSATTTPTHVAPGSRLISNSSSSGCSRVSVDNNTACLDSGAPALALKAVLLLDLGPLPTSGTQPCQKVEHEGSNTTQVAGCSSIATGTSTRLAYSLHQHLYQEAGFKGAAWARDDHHLDTLAMEGPAAGSRGSTSQQLPGGPSSPAELVIPALQLMWVRG